MNYKNTGVILWIVMFFLMIAMIVFFFVVILPAVSAENTLLPFSARVNLNNREHTGNFTINLFNILTGGTNIYNETFTDSISGGRAKAILGYQNVTLNLTGGNIYFLELFVDQTRNMSMNVNGTQQRRVPFVAPFQADKSANVSSLIINGNDPDDALNVTGGGFFTNSLVINNLFNVTVFNSQIRTNGTLTISSLLSPALSIQGFNVSGSSAALSTNGSILVNNLFNVTGSTGNVGVGGTLRLGGVATFLNNLIINSFFNVTVSDSQIRTNGTLTIRSIDSDDALNVTGGVKMLQNLTVEHNITAANYYGNGSALSGITTSDYEWERVAWNNFSSATEFTVTGLTGSNLYRVEYIINVAKQGANGNHYVNFRVNNLSNAIYTNLYMNSTDPRLFKNQNNISLFILRDTSGTDPISPVTEFYGDLKFYQSNQSGGVLKISSSFYPQMLFSIGADTTNCPTNTDPYLPCDSFFLASTVNLTGVTPSPAQTIGNITFFVMTSAGTTPTTINGTSIVYRHKSFNIY